MLRSQQRESFSMKIILDKNSWTFVWNCKLLIILSWLKMYRTILTTMFDNGWKQKVMVNLGLKEILIGNTVNNISEWIKFFCSFLKSKRIQKFIKYSQLVKIIFVEYKNIIFLPTKLPLSFMKCFELVWNYRKIKGINFFGTVYMLHLLYEHLVLRELGD